MDQDEDQQDDASVGSEDGSVEVEGRKTKKNVSLWFDKLEPFISHFRDASESMIHTLGTNLSLCLLHLGDRAFTNYVSRFFADFY